MPMHDWTKVDAGIYHAMHFNWIAEVNRALQSSLPEGYYAMPEQPRSDTATATLARPRAKVVQESAGDFYRRKQNRVAIRHVSDHRLVAVIEIVSPGNKDSNARYRTFVKKARELLERRIHLLIIDPFPPPAKHKKGLHFDIAGDKFPDAYRLTPAAPLSLIAYECDDPLRAYVEPYRVGDRLIDMPAYLEPGEFVEVPLEATYMAAWATIPPVWRTVLAG